MQQHVAPSDIPWQNIDHLGHRDLLRRNLFSVSWILGRFCNYRCSYCWPHGRSDTKDYRATSLILSTMSEIKRQARANGLDAFHFSFTGGEPTFHPGYLEIVREYAAESRDHGVYQSLHMTSNCSPGLKWFEKYIEATRGVNELGVGASFHSEFAEREKFLEKMLFLQRENAQVLVTIVMAPAKFEQLHETGRYFHEHGLNVSLKPQSNEDATEIVGDYSVEQLEIMSRDLLHTEFDPQIWLKSSSEKYELDRYELDHAERFNSVGFNKFTGWSCSAGFRSIIIREPCGSIKRGHSCHDKPLGTLETGFQLFPEVKLCATPSCLCSSDSKIPKRKVTSREKLWAGEEC
jgi:organic radical activating enzyme